MSSSQPKPTLNLGQKFIFLIFFPQLTNTPNSTSQINLYNSHHSVKSTINLLLGGLIAARSKGVRTPNKHGVQPLHAPLERRAGAARHSQHAARHSQHAARHSQHAARHVHAYNRHAHGEQACRACTPVWRACKACTPFGQACRPCTPVGSRKTKVPYKVQVPFGRTLIGYFVPLLPGSRQPLDLRGLREPRDWDYVHRSSDCAAHVSLSNREAYVSQPRSVPLELTWARVPNPPPTTQPERHAPNDQSTDPPPR
ncbi:hypothetical protein PCANC_24828 [Puccinia coronata f. sp. avenae]|uniref:Uncharacterized protein n=1 Tax=Puccinia coronata f. sp. avenae TaxID=200324 RepID=A0A2N5TJM9_9BASI|nr:hypothetical protein PCANC_24828 [Puccinia coronata f. sp. avenae]